MTNPDETAKLVLETVPRLMHSLRVQLRTQAKPFLTVPQFRTLARLSFGSATNSDLAEWIGVSPPAMSRMIDILVGRKLVERKADSKDRRTVHLQLTKKGVAYVQRVRGAVQKNLSQRISGLVPADISKLYSGLLILSDIFPWGLG